MIPAEIDCEIICRYEFCVVLLTDASVNSRLATALAHAYDVIEMCAPAAPPIRLRIRTRTLNPNPNPSTHPNPIFNRNPNRFF